jgi:hypothetical protein
MLTPGAFGAEQATMRTAGTVRKAGYSGPRGRAGSGKRAAIKRDWLASIADGRRADDWKALAARRGSTESSTRSIIGDLQAFMRQCSLPSPFAEAVGRGRPNPALEMINRTLISEPGIRTGDLMTRMERAGIFAQRGHIGGSLAASRESLDILREFGALRDDGPESSQPQPQPQNSSQKYLKFSDQAIWLSLSVG